MDEHRDEEPGKILHELRVGEMAHLDEIPQTPYYGSIDATPLFLILLARHAEWTGDLALFRELRPNVERALSWMKDHGDANHDGYLEYASRSRNGLSNQGWKDSGDAIVDGDGSLALPPIALVEVQGYAYCARNALADLYERSGEHDRALQLQREASDLAERFNRDFWMADRGYYALALAKEDRRADVISSNPGQALWTGIVDASHTRAVVDHLMAEDMFSGWGVRTLSEKERRYNPIGYHLGTVWPHDNAIIAAGVKRSGFDVEACRIFQGQLEAALGFPFDRLPEVFAGFSRRDYSIPVRYPVACHPQAWAAGAIPWMMTTLLGLVPEGFEHRLRIVRPVLPDLIRHVEVHQLAVGGAFVDLVFDRTPEGALAVNVAGIKGQLDVVIEPATNSPV